MGVVLRFMKQTNVALSRGKIKDQEGFPPTPPTISTIMDVEASVPVKLLLSKAIRSGLLSGS